MNPKKIFSLLFTLVLTAGLSYAQTASSSSSGSSDQTTTTTKKTKKEKVKSAGSDVKEGTEKAAKATAHGTEKAATATAHGSETAAKATATKTKDVAGGVKSGVTGKSEKLDINTATTDQLDTLPGVGPALAQKIVEGRPYTAKNDLVRRNVIPQSTYDGIKDQIIAHRAGTASGAKAAKK
jgi:competence protein ComEA